MSEAKAGGGMEPVMRDCVLYKTEFTGSNQYNVEIIVSIPSYTTIVEGLYQINKTFVGGTPVDNYDVTSIAGSKIVNAFKIDTGEEVEWMINGDGDGKKIENKQNNTMVFCIRSPVPKIYTTTGDIFIDTTNKIISTNAVFIDFDKNRLEFIPGATLLQASQNAPPLPQMDALTQSMKTYHLLFHLNCVKGFDTIKPLQKGQNDSVKTEAIKNFAKLMIAQIVLDPENINLNSRFLIELRKLGILDVENDINKPIIDLLQFGDKFITPFLNCPNVYCNAGRNFTKMFRLKKEGGEFNELIDKTLALYNAQVDECLKFINAELANPNSVIKPILLQMQEHVLTQMVRPSKFLIVNVKTRKEPDAFGNRKPINERYQMMTDSQHSYLAIDAVESAVPLYTKVTGKDLMEMNTSGFANTKGEISFDASTKMVIANRTNKLICGPFDYIANPDLDNQGISELPKINQLIDTLYANNYLCVFGKGISGSGKTTIMINNVHGATPEAKKGVIFHLCEKLHSESRFMCNQITLRRSEICASTGNCDDDATSYVFNWKNVNGVDGFFCETETFTTKYKIAGTLDFCKPDNKENPTSYSCSITDKSLHEVAEILLTKTRSVNATALNRSSSRSHAMIVMQIYCADKTTRFLTAVDAAGKENIIKCKYAMLVKYANSLAENGTDRSYYDQTNATIKREDIIDFTNLNNLTQFIEMPQDSTGGVSRPKITNKLDEVKNVLHVLRGCPRIKEEKLILEDADINNLIKNYRQVNIEEISIKPSLDGSDYDKKYPIVNEITKQIKKLQKIVKKPVWTKDNKIIENGLIKHNSSIASFYLNENYSADAERFRIIFDKTESGKDKTYMQNSNTVKYLFLQEKGKEWSSKTGQKSEQGILIDGKYEKKEDYEKSKDTDAIISLFANYEMKKEEVSTDENYKKMYTEFDEFVDKKSEFNKEFEEWKKGSKDSLTFFVSANKKVTLGPLSNYKQDEDKNLKKFLDTNYSVSSARQQFYENVKRIKEEFERFHHVIAIVSPQCEARGIEGSTVINPELDKADTGINDICVLQNQGRPSLPLQILGNTEPYDYKHIYNILKGSSAKGDIKQSVKNSRILKNMFDIIIALSSAKEGSELPTYDQIARTIKFVFFTVVNWSPDTELPDKVQYYHTRQLRKLLEKMEYESEFENYSAQKEGYIKEFTDQSNAIQTYYIGQNLSRVVEIELLIGKIKVAYEKLKTVGTYDMAILTVKEIVDETNNINASSLVGSVANDGKTCITQNVSGLQLELLPQVFSVSLRPQPVIQ